MAMNGGKSIRQSSQMPAHRHVEEFVALKTVRRKPIDDEVQRERERAQRSECARVASGMRSVGVECASCPSRVGR